jgi:SAM-dependent methyltransferase
VAESFGSDPERYDRTRPRYPDAMVDRMVAASPGPDALDVGCGTGIAARQLQAAGCRVLGVDPDARGRAGAATRGRGRGGDLRGLGPGRPDLRRVYRRVLPDLPVFQRATSGLESYSALCARSAWRVIGFLAVG